MEQKKKANQRGNLIAHYQTMIDYHRRQMEYYRKNSRNDSQHKLKG